MPLECNYFAGIKICQSTEEIVFLSFIRFDWFDLLNVWWRIINFNRKCIWKLQFWRRTTPRYHKRTETEFAEYDLMNVVAIIGGCGHFESSIIDARYDEHVTDLLHIYVSIPLRFLHNFLIPLHCSFILLSAPFYWKRGMTTLMKLLFKFE